MISLLCPIDRLIDLLSIRSTRKKFVIFREEIYKDAKFILLEKVCNAD